MKKEFKTIIVFTILFFTTVLLAQENKKLELMFFGSSTCGECMEIKLSLLEPLVNKNPDKLAITFYDIDSDSGFLKANIMEERYGIKEPSPQELFFPDTFLLGYNSIMEHGKDFILSRMNSSLIKKNLDINNEGKSVSEYINKRLSKFTFWQIVAAGIADGINPCAIATIIFLISFLSTRKKSGQEILVIGLTFTLTVFMTYTLIGAGIFKAVSAMKAYSTLSEVIKYIAILMALTVSLLSFWDALAYRKNKDSNKIKLQLPKAVKLSIHKVISGNLSNSSLITGTVITGFLVTLLEAVCTGQVYLPTIILMTKSTEFGLLGWVYLLFYNFLFVLPLFIIMILAYFGLKWNKLAKITQKNMTGVKILMGLVMLFMAIFLFIAG